MSLASFLFAFLSLLPGVFPSSSPSYLENTKFSFYECKSLRPEKEAGGTASSWLAGRSVSSQGQPATRGELGYQGEVGVGWLKETARKERQAVTRACHLQSSGRWGGLWLLALAYQQTKFPSHQTSSKGKTTRQCAIPLPLEWSSVYKAQVPQKVLLSQPHTLGNTPPPSLE